MNQVISDEEVDYWIGSNSTKKAVARAIESAVLSKFGEPVGYYEPNAKLFIHDTTHPKYYLRLYALKKEDTE